MLKIQKGHGNNGVVFFELFSYISLLIDSPFFFFFLIGKEA